MSVREETLLKNKTMDRDVVDKRIYMDTAVCKGWREELVAEWLRSIIISKAG